MWFHLQQITVRIKTERRSSRGLPEHSFLLFFFSSFLLLLFCFVGELRVKTNPPVYFTSVSNSTTPNCRCGPLARATLQTVGLKQKEGQRSEDKNRIEPLPISCKHMMSSSHAKITDHRNSKTDWGKKILPLTDQLQERLFFCCFFLIPLTELLFLFLLTHNIF